MEQMIQQMMLGGGNPNNNNNNSNSIADHPMIRQLQSQFPDHNIRDLLQQMSSPYAQQQMERSLELQLSQLDHLPGGMNLIQNAYREQMEQASNNTNNTNSGSSSSDSNINPMQDFLSGLGGGSGMGRSSQGHATDNNYNNNNTMAGPMGQAMPNPWSSHQPFPRRRRLVAPTAADAATTTTRVVTTTSTTPSNANPSTQNPWNMTTHSSTSTQPVGMTATPMDESTSRHPDDNHDDNNNSNNSTQVNEELLYEMGFTDRTLNRRILLEQDNNLDRTVEALLLLSSSRPRDS
jgi:hypothetical protein